MAKSRLSQRYFQSNFWLPSLWNGTGEAPRLALAPAGPILWILSITLRLPSASAPYLHLLLHLHLHVPFSLCSKSTTVTSKLSIDDHIPSYPGPPKATPMAQSSALADIQRLVWHARLPLEIRLAPAECRVYDKADPYLVSRDSLCLQYKQRN